MADLTEATPAVRLDSVSKHYSSQVALHPTNLDIREGEFLSLLGPSGCGKTTTLNLIGGFVAPSEGNIFLQGTRIDNLPAHKRDLSTVFQSYALFPHMTVEENVAFGLKIAKVSAREISSRVSQALDQVNMGAFGKKLPGELSGGQQQRIAVARALVTRPSLVLLDEPLGALDLKLRKHMQFELSTLQKEIGITFLYVTHDQEEAMAMSDRIAVMSEGRIEQLDTPENIYLHPANSFVAGFVGSSNIFEIDHQRMVGDGSTALTLPEGLIGAAATEHSGLHMIRPENVEISATPTSNSLTARILNSAFLGPNARVVLQLDHVDTLLTASPYGAEAMRVARQPAGTEVHVTWSGADLVCLD